MLGVGVFVLLADVVGVFDGTTMGVLVLVAVIVGVAVGTLAALVTLISLEPCGGIEALQLFVKLPRSDLLHISCTLAEPLKPRLLQLAVTVDVLLPSRLKSATVYVPSEFLVFQTCWLLDWETGLAGVPV